MGQNMKRFRRGEISRVNPQKGVHTDVHFGALPEKSQAAAGAKPDATVQKLTDKVTQLQTENAELKKATADLDNQQKDGHVELTAKLDAVKAENGKLAEERDELERQLQERSEPVTGLRVLSVTGVSEADSMLRIDCEFKPTNGPLGGTGAIVLPISEVEKLTVKDEAEEDTAEEDEEEAWGEDADAEGDEAEEDEEEDDVKG